MLKRDISLELPEEDIQKYLFDWIGWHGLQNICFAIANQRKCSPAYGQKLKKMGVKAGVSDIFIARSMHGFHGCYLELKTKNGKLSPEQKEFLTAMNKEGYLTLVSHSLDDAIRCVDVYLRKDARFLPLLYCYYFPMRQGAS